MLAELRHAASNSLECQDAISSRIPSLFQWCSPLHIAGFIASAVIKPLKRLSCWSLAHIFQKILERHPSLTDYDSARSVVLETDAIRIGASLNHRRPAMVGGRELSTAVSSDGRMPMFRQFTANLGVVVTTAGASVSRTQSATRDLDNSSALALAFTPSDQTSRWYSSRRQFANHFELSKGLAEDRYCSRHNGIALCSAAGVGYRPNARCASVIPFSRIQVKGVSA